MSAKRIGAADAVESEGIEPEKADSEAIRRYLRRLTVRGLGTSAILHRWTQVRRFHRFLVAEGIRPDHSTERDRACKHIG